MSELAAFLGVAVVVIVTPGPDTALTIRNTLFGGRRAGVFTAVGVASGQATWTVATAAGMSALLAASEPVFRTVKLVGAAYLILLGLQALWAAVARGDRVGSAARRPADVLLTPRAALRQGLVSNLTNPKMAAFFPALLPQFAAGGRADFVVFLSLGLLFSAMTFVWLAGYACVVARAGDFLRRSQLRRAIEAATGVVLVGLGLGLATERA